MCTQFCKLKNMYDKAHTICLYFMTPSDEILAHPPPPVTTVFSQSQIHYHSKIKSKRRSPLWQFLMHRIL
jgi:hypothetical protein